MDISILIYIIFGILVIILIWIFLLERRFARIFKGSNSKNLEEAIIYFNKQLIELKENNNKLNKNSEILNTRLNKSIRKVETIRFNPFEDAGSNQSFAIALINDEEDGVILSSLYARDRMSIFAKPVISGKSKFELSKEEKEVLERALSN